LCTSPSWASPLGLIVALGRGVAIGGGALWPREAPPAKKPMRIVYKLLDEAILKASGLLGELP